jgi:multiple sugar transport system substrate-binding protein
MNSHIISRRRFLNYAGVAGAVAGAAAVSGCTLGVPGDTHRTDSGRPSGLRALYATVEANAAAVQSLLPAFREAFGFDLTLDTQPYDALQQKVFSELATRSPYYDIIIVDTPWAPTLTHVLEPMSQYLRNPSLNQLADPAINDFVPKVFYDTGVFKIDDPTAHYPEPEATPDIDQVNVNGFEVLGLPIQTNVLMMGYRKDMFDDPREQAAFRQQHGRPLAVPETLDDLVTVGRFFTRPERRLYGTTLMGGVGDWSTCDFKSYLAAFGGDGHLLSDDLHMAFDSPAGVQALQFMRDLVDKYKIVPPGSESASWDDTASMFNGGLTAMSSNYHTFELGDTVRGGEIGYTVVPKGSSRGPHFGSYMLSINKYSRFKEWAYQAITWITAAEQQMAMVQKELHPTRASVYDKAADDSSLTEKYGNFYSALGKSLNVGVGRPRLTNYTEVSHDIAVQVNNAVAGRVSPQAALTAAATDVRDTLRKADYPVPST